MKHRILVHQLPIHSLKSTTECAFAFFSTLKSNSIRSRNQGKVHYNRVSNEFEFLSCSFSSHLGERDRTKQLLIHTRDKWENNREEKVCQPESQFSGLSGSGWAIKAIIALQTDWRVQAGLQAFFKISRQISPVWKITRC